MILDDFNEKRSGVSMAVSVLPVSNSSLQLFAATQNTDLTCIRSRCLDATSSTVGVFKKQKRGVGREIPSKICYEPCKLVHFHPFPVRKDQSSGYVRPEHVGL